LKKPDKPWFSRGFIHIWDHTMREFDIRGMGIEGEYTKNSGEYHLDLIG
jgi:hypothetical protein